MNNEESKVVKLVRNNDLINNNDKEIERLNNEINRITNERNYYMNEYNKALSYIHNYNMSLTTNIYNQFQSDFNNFKYIQSELSKELKQENDKLKDNEIKRLKEENKELKDNIISDKNKKIQRLEEENNKLNNKIKQIISYYIDGKDIKEIILNLLRINNKDGE